jgi:hypothetical protein
MSRAILFMCYRNIIIQHDKMYHDVLDVNCSHETFFMCTHEYPHVNFIHRSLSTFGVDTRFIFPLKTLVFDHNDMSVIIPSLVICYKLCSSTYKFSCY